MVAAEVPADVQNFWVPVSQIVPVFGLALIIEARRLARVWKIEAAWTRRSQSIVMLVASLILLEIWIYTLTFMAKGETDPLAVTLTRFGLVVVFAGLAYTPVISMLTIANADLGFRILKWLPFTPLHKTRRQIELLRRELKAASDEVLAQEKLILDNLVENSRNRKVARKNQRKARALALLDLTDIQRAEMDRVLVSSEKILASTKARRTDMNTDLVRVRQWIIYANESFERLDQASSIADPRVMSDLERDGLQGLLDDFKAGL